MMAEHPDVRTGEWPEPPAPATPSLLRPRPIGGRAPRFGVAHELDVLRGAPATKGRPPTAPERAATHPTAGAWDGMRTWWACRESRPVDVWHRLLCRLGRHDVRGGQQIQVGGRFVHVERCCVWCRSKPT